jgi:hypothetical protein
VSYSYIKRSASICTLATLVATASALVTTADAQEPPAASPAAGAASPASPAPPGMPPKNRMISRPRTGVPPTVASPHGVKKQSGPRIVGAPDLPQGEIEVRVAAKGLDNIENQQVTLAVSKRSIERGNIDSTLTALTDVRGVARFPEQGTATDFVYTATVSIGAARYSTNEFQFRDTTPGLRVIIPVYPSTAELEGLLLLSRTAIAIIPQDDLFAIDVMWRIENFGEVSWLPENVIFPLPDGFEALNIRNPKAEARFEPAGDGVKLAGTFSPGQHDLMFRFHLPTEGKSERSFSFPTTLNVGMVRVIMDSAPTMELKVDGFPEPDETRNPEGQRRLVSGRDFLSEKTRAPEKVQINISGIPTPPAGRSVAVGLAGLIALAGFAQAAGRRSAKAPRSNLSNEERERAGELLLEELISLEQAFKQGAIGRKTHEQARRQLLEAFARLGAGTDTAPGKAEASRESAPAGA